MASTPIVNALRGAALGPGGQQPHPGGGPGGLEGLNPPKAPPTIPGSFGRPRPQPQNSLLAAHILLAILAHPAFRAGA